MLFPILKTNFNFSVTFILLSPSAINLDRSRIVLFGKQLNNTLHNIFSKPLVAFPCILQWLSRSSFWKIPCTIFFRSHWLLYCQNNGQQRKRGMNPVAVTIISPKTEIGHAVLWLSDLQTTLKHWLTSEYIVYCTGYFWTAKNFKKLKEKKQWSKTRQRHVVICMGKVNSF